MARNDLKIVLEFDLPVFGADECPGSAFEISYKVPGPLEREVKVPVTSVISPGNKTLGRISFSGTATPLGILPEVTNL